MSALFLFMLYCLALFLFAWILVFVEGKNGPDGMSRLEVLLTGLVALLFWGLMLLVAERQIAHWNFWFGVTAALFGLVFGGRLAIR